MNKNFFKVHLSSGSSGITFLFLYKSVKTKRTNNAKHACTKSTTVLQNSDLQYVRYSLQQLQQFGVAIIRDSALFGKVMVVGWDEFSDWHQAAGLVFHQVYDFSTELDQLWISYRALTAL